MLVSRAGVAVCDCSNLKSSEPAQIQPPPLYIAPQEYSLAIHCSRGEATTLDGGSSQQQWLSLTLF